MRHILDKSLDKLSNLLDIPDVGGQDWDLIHADCKRVEEFCHVYEQGSLDDYEKSALMELIVASYDDYLNEPNPQSELEDRVYRLLTADYELHKSTIEYWSRLQSYDRDNSWAVSPLMRKILRERSGEA